MGAAASQPDPVFAGPVLLLAAATNSSHRVASMLKLHPQMATYTSPLDGNSVAHVAAAAGHTEVLRTVVIHLRSSGCAAAHADCLKKRTGVVAADSAAAPSDAVATLLRRSNSRGQSPLAVAARRGRTAAVRYLLSQGADPWQFDADGITCPLHEAARKGRAAIVDLLLSYAHDDPARGAAGPNASRAYVDVPTACGFTALHYAVFMSAAATVQLLLQHGANPHIRNVRHGLGDVAAPAGSLPLHLAAVNGNVAIVEMLLSAYLLRATLDDEVLDPRLCRDVNGRTPLMLAVELRNYRAAALLTPSAAIAAGMPAPGGAVIGPPSLSCLAAAALKQGLQHVLSERERELGPSGPKAITQRPASAENLQQRCAPPRSSSRPEVKLLHNTEHDNCQAGRDPCSCHVSTDEIDFDSAAAASPGQTVCPSACSSSSSSGRRDSCAEQDHGCTICFTSRQALAVDPCGHALCVACCKRLVAFHSSSTPVGCPFCRTAIRSFNVAIA